MLFVYVAFRKGFAITEITQFFNCELPYYDMKTKAFEEILIYIYKQNTDIYFEYNTQLYNILFKF